MVVASILCAGLLWASQSLTDLLHWLSGSQVRVPARTLPDVRADSRVVVAIRSIIAHRASRTRVDVPANAPSNALSRDLASVAPPSGLPASLTQPAFSMSGPNYLSDPAAAQARSIAVGDVSGDGRDDLVFLAMRYAPNPMNDRMEIYVAYQSDDGRLDAAVKIAESGNNLAYQLLIADLDQDGVDDIITATIDGVMVLRSNGDRTFAVSSAVVGDPHDIVVADVDRDGHLDILVDSSNTLATLLHGDGRGGIERISTLPLPSSAVRTTGDVTGDGLDDLILATIFGRPLQEIWIYPALASGGYAAPEVLYRPIDANQTVSLAVGDFNADGRGDLVLDEARDYASLHMYLQDSHGRLTSSREIPRLRGAGSVIATDLDRDGRTDLAFSHTGWGYIGYYIQTSTGFTPETVIEVYQHHGRKNYFATGDLNHDGCGDLVVSRWGQSPVLIYGQGCAHPRIADCRLPARRVEGSGLQASNLATQLIHPLNSNTGANARESLVRGASSGIEPNEYR